MRFDGVGCSFGSEFLSVFFIYDSACKVGVIRNTLHNNNPVHKRSTTVSSKAHRKSNKREECIAPIF